jgi:hypothetical protein
MLTEVRIRKDDNLELIGLMIFDYFELREIVNMGKVSRVFYELTGRKEVLNKFFPSVSKKLSKTSIIVESLDNEYGASLSKKPL